MMLKSASIFSDKAPKCYIQMTLIRRAKIGDYWKNTLTGDSKGNTQVLTGFSSEHHSNCLAKAFTHLRG